MDDSDLVLIREPVRFNLALYLPLLAGGYVLVFVAMLIRVYLHVGGGRRSFGGAGGGHKRPTARRRRLPTQCASQPGAADAGAARGGFSGRRSTARRTD